MSKKKSGLASLACIMLLTSACIPAVDERPIKTSRPSTTERPLTTPAKREPEPTIKTEVKGDLVNITVEQGTECQETVRAPMEEDTGTERSLKGGTLAQVINLGTAAGLIAGGIAVYSSAGGSCTKTPDATAQNQNPASRPCTTDEADKEKQTAQGWGIGLTSLSVLPLGAFVWNIFRAQDDKKTIKTTKESSSPWAACGVRPLEGIHLTLTLTPSTSGGSETKLSATTNGQGKATVDLARSRSTSDQAGLLVLLPKGQQTSYVSLRETPMRVASNTEAKEASLAVKRTEARTSSLQLLQEIEQGLARLQNTKWPNDDILLFERLLSKLPTIKETIVAGGVELSEPDRQRFQSITPKLEKLAPAYDKARAAYIARADAIRAQQDQVYLANGWAGLKGQLVAPSTASLVGTRILLRCSRGRIIHYDFDSQNRMGAMLRGRGVVKINDVGFNARIHGEIVGDMSPYEILVRAAEEGNCKDLE